MSQTFNVAELAAAYANKSPQDILKLAFEHFGRRAVDLSSSGAEDVVLLDMAWKLNKQVKVFTLDTGRLHPETYRFIEQVREHYGIAIEVMSPDAQKLQDLVRERRACSVSTRMAMASAAAFARSSRSSASWPRSRPGPPGSAAIRAQALAARLPCSNWMPPSPRRSKPLYKFNPLAR